MKSNKAKALFLLTQTLDSQCQQRITLNTLISRIHLMEFLFQPLFLVEEEANWRHWCMNQKIGIMAFLWAQVLDLRPLLLQ